MSPWFTEASTGRQWPLGSTRLPGLGPGIAEEDLWAQSVRQETVSKGKLRQAELAQGWAGRQAVVQTAASAGLASRSTCCKALK